MRGTWKGTGTWKTSGPDLGSLAVLAVVGLLIIAAIEWLLARRWWVLGGTVLFAAAVAAVLIAVIRWTDRREARWADRRRAELAMQAEARQAMTATVIPQAVREEPRPAISSAPQIVNQFFIADAAQAAAIFRHALPKAGDAITEEE